MIEEIIYRRVKPFLIKIRLFKYVKYIRSIPKKYLKHEENIMEKQPNEIQKFGKYAEVKIGRYKFVLDRSELHDFAMLKTFESGRIYEPEVSSYIMENLKLGETFMDIGANNGYYTILAADLVGPKGKVISLEPNPNAFQRLLHNIEINNLKNIIPLKIALSDKDGKTTLYLNSGSEDGLASLIKGEQFESFLEVELKRLDDLFEDEKINIIKMDVEGSEINVIRGAENYIKSHKGIKVIMEWNYRYRTNNDFNYLSRLFHINLLFPDKELGFKIIEITKFESLIESFVNLLLEPKN